MNKKYLVFSGVVYASDGDTHWISARAVACLYKLNPEECVFADPKYPEEYIGYRNQDLIELSPRKDGNYNLDEIKEIGIVRGIRRQKINAWREREEQSRVERAARRAAKSGTNLRYV